MMGRISIMPCLGLCGAAFMFLATASSAQNNSVSNSVDAAIASLPPIRSEGGDRPQVGADRAGNLILRNRHLVAVLAKKGSGYGSLALFGNPRPGTEVNEPLAVVLLSPGSMSGALHATVKGERVILTSESDTSPRPAALSLEIGDEPWLGWELSGGAEVSEQVTPIIVKAGYGGAREALFPGVAYLQGTDRKVPGLVAADPHHITVPLMAHSQDGSTVALLWNPSSARAGGSGYPRALFQPESDGATRMELSLGPSRTQGNVVTTNRLAGKLVVLRDNPDPASAIREWARAYSPRASENPRSFSEERQLSRTAFTRTLWSTDTSGWRLSADASDSMPYSFGTQALLMDAAFEKSRVKKGELRQQAQKVLASLQANGPLDPPLAYRLGEVGRSLDAERARVMELVDSQLPEGDWLQKPGSRTTGSYTPGALSEAGAVADNALPILRFAAITGDSDAAGAGRRSIAYLERLRLPGSAGSTSVPAGTPGLITAARVAECFLLAYQMNGSREYLRTARYWADVGLGFVYLWGDAERPAMRFSAVSEMGMDQTGPALASPTAALNLARVLSALHTVRHDELYDTVARGILATAMRQQVVSGDAAGLLPQYWNVKDGTPEGRQVSPWPLLEVLYRQAGYDPDVSTARVRVGSDRFFVASGATISVAATTATRLRLNLRGVPGATAITTVIGVPALPFRVEYNSRSALPFGIKTDHRYLLEGEPEADDTWTYQPETGLLTIRIRHTGDDDHLEIRWPDPRERAPVKPADRAIRPHR